CSWWIEIKTSGKQGGGRERNFGGSLGLERKTPPQAAGFPPWRCGGLRVAFASSPARGPVVVPHGWKRSAGKPPPRSSQPPRRRGGQRPPRSARGRPSWGGAAGSPLPPAAALPAFLAVPVCAIVRPPSYGSGLPWASNRWSIPPSPDLNAFVERLHGTCERAYRQRLLPGSREATGERLPLCQHPYTTERPHQGRSCDTWPPAVAPPQLPMRPRLPARVDPARWRAVSHERCCAPRVPANGSLLLADRVDDVGSTSIGPEGV